MSWAWYLHPISTEALRTLPDLATTFTGITMTSSSRALPPAHENHQECRANRRGSRFQDDTSQAPECRRRPPQEKRGFHLETQEQEWELSGGTSMTPQRMAPTGVIVAGTRPAGQGFHPGQPLLPSHTLPNKALNQSSTIPYKSKPPGSQSGIGGAGDEAWTGPRCTTHKRYSGHGNQHHGKRQEKQTSRGASSPRIRLKPNATKR